MNKEEIEDLLINFVNYCYSDDKEREIFYKVIKVWIEGEEEYLELLETESKDYEGTEGQDRESYNEVGE